MLKNKEDHRENEFKKLQKKVTRLESCKSKLKEREEEVSILTNHLDEINNSHNSALEKVQSLAIELEREK